MVEFPIHVSRDSYRGSNLRRREKANETNRLAARLEQYINERLKAQEASIQVYGFHEIADATNVPLEIVQELCFSIDGGSNGFTAIKPGMTYQRAMAEMDERNAAARKP